MKNIEELKKIINLHKAEIEGRFHVKSIAIFGSYTRSEQLEESDVDILVEFNKPVGLEFIHLADYLEELLGVKVDLLTPAAIKPNRRESIMEEAVYV